MEAMSFIRTCSAAVLLAFGVLAFGANPARAEQITLSATDAEFTFDGSTFIPGGTIKGMVGLDIALKKEDRYALQFDLSPLPTGAIITDVQLGLRNVTSQGTDVLSGFAGNGTFSSSSVTAGTDLLSFTSTTTTIEFHDVTTFVQGLAPGQEAGFSLRQSPLSTSPDLFETELSKLVITFTAPVPEPTSVSLLCVGVAGLLGYAWRKRRARA